MSNAARHSEPLASPLSAQRGGLSLPTPARMNFYDLQNHLWELHAVERFTGNQISLYFYWLNLFNAGLNGEYWPAQYPRFGTQVQADLGLTDKTLAAARKVLESRGLLYHKEGSKTKAAVWSLAPIVRNNSGQFEAIASNMTQNNSGQCEQKDGIASNMTRNNSGQCEQKDGIASNMTRNNSGPYKEKTEDSSRTEDTNKKKGGEGEPDFPPFESQKNTAPNPVAPPLPQAAAPALGSMNPCLVPGTEASRSLASAMAAMWHITESKNQRRYAQFATFTRTLAAADRLDEVRQQFEAYARYRQLRGLSPFGIEKYLGHELEGYADGEWCGCDWPALLAEATQQAGKKAFGPAEAPARASASSTKKSSWA